MAEGFRNWLLDGDNLVESSWGSWSLGPPPPAEPFNMNDGRIGAVVDRTARELGLHGDMASSPRLKQALFHIVSVLNPTVGHGGLLMYQMMDYVTKFMVRKSVEHHTRTNAKTPFDPEEDDHLSSVGSPMRLLRHLWAMWGKVHPQANLQGSAGFDDEADSRYWSKWQKKKEEENPAPTPSPPGNKDLSVIRVIEAMPNSMLQGLDLIGLQHLADSLAKVMGGTRPTDKEFEEMMIRKGLVGKAT